MDLPHKKRKDALSEPKNETPSSNRASKKVKRNYVLKKKDREEFRVKKMLSVVVA